MWMTIQARIVSGVHVGAEVSPNHSGVGNLLGAVVRSTAVVLVAGGALPSVLQPVICGRWRTVNQNGRLKLDCLSISEVFVNDLVKDRLLNVASIRLKVEPVIADIVLA